MPPNFANGGKQDKVVRHVKEHYPEMGIGERADEAVNLKVGQSVCLAFFVHHVR
jgi:hypothetical protein